MHKLTEHLSHVRDLLRHIDHPERLRRNPLIERYFRDGVEPITAAARVKHLVEQLLDGLPERQREIIRRCDLRGEPHPAVILALAVSERHFYRERRSAFEFVAASLARAARTELPRQADACQDAIALHLSFADAAHQVGDTEGALRALRRFSNEVVDPAIRLRLECRLAELCCEAGMIDDARHHIGVARSIAAARENDRQQAAARVDAVDALVAWTAGNSSLGAQLAERATRLLRERLQVGTASANAEAFALASIVLNKRDIALGRWESARELALEAGRALLASDSRRAALTMRVQAAATEAYMLDATRLADAACEFERQYHEALSRGFMLEAMKIAWPLAQFDRFADSPLLTAGKLQQLLPVARHVLPADERAEMCLGLASAYLACRESAKAHDLIAEARTNAKPGGLSFALSYIVAADTFFFEQSFGQAVRLSRFGWEAMRLLDNRRFMGSALRIQADATFALGEHDAAKSLIRDALSHLDTVGHPFVIARAHRSAARITGSETHHRIANDVLAKLRKSAGWIAGR